MSSATLATNVPGAADRVNRGASAGVGAPDLEPFPGVL